MTVPVVNASVTLIAGGGTIGDYGSDDGAETTIDANSHDAYLDEQLVTVPGAGKLDILRKSYLVVDDDVAKICHVDDSVTYTFDGATSVRRIQTIRRYKAFGTGRLYLYDS